MPIGDQAHKQELCESLIKTYQENIWKDEIYLMALEEDWTTKLSEIAAIKEKQKAKGYPTKNDGDRAKFTAEEELAGIENTIREVKQKIEVVWPARIRHTKTFLANE